MRTRWVWAVSAILLSLVTVVVGCSRKPAVAGLPTEEQFSKSLDEVIDYTAHRRLTTKDHAAWQVIHGAEAFGKDFLISADGQEVKAIEYVCSGKPLKGWNLFVTEHGVGSNTETNSSGMGHHDQWLGYLSQCGVKPTDPLVVGGKDYTIQAFIDESQWNIEERDDAEGAWTLMAFTTYLPLDVRWKNCKGEEWTIERLVKMECHTKNEDLYAGPCGGSHALYALAVAVNRYRHENPSTELSAAWKLAHERVQRAIQDAKANQNVDGTFSANSFLRASSSSDVVQQIRTTGHVLEFLCVALDEKELQAPWVTRAAVTLTSLLKNTKDIDVECGALYHAAHALILYRDHRLHSVATPSAE